METSLYPEWMQHTCFRVWDVVCAMFQNLCDFHFNFTTHVKLHKLFQICKQVVTKLLSSRYQDVFALLVLSCCDKSGTSCYHLVTRSMTVTDLLQVIPTRLIQVNTC